jgi:glucan phosphoethanolaminetransferase (alkaline phosphatase superfamily)
MDISAAIFVFLLALPVFFFWRWVFRKKNSIVRRRILVWLATILSAPVIYTVLIVAWMSIVEYYPNHYFDAKAWKTDSDSRYEYSHDLIGSKILVGKTKQQVMGILGKYDDTSQAEWYYYIGYRPELTGTDPSNIYVEFKNGRVESVEENDK